MKGIPHAAKKLGIRFDLLNERVLAFERFELPRPSPEEGVPLARLSRDEGIALRTARSGAGRYRHEGLAGLARKWSEFRSDQGCYFCADPPIWATRRSQSSPRSEGVSCISSRFSMTRRPEMSSA